MLAAAATLPPQRITAAAAAAWLPAARCEDLLALRSQLSGLSVLSSSSEEVVLGICLKLPTARQPAADAAGAAAAGVGKATAAGAVAAACSLVLLVVCSACDETVVAHYSRSVLLCTCKG